MKEMWHCDKCGNFWDDDDAVMESHKDFIGYYGSEEVYDTTKSCTCPTCGEELEMKNPVIEKEFYWVDTQYELPADGTTVLCLTYLDEVGKYMVNQTTYDHGFCCYVDSHGVVHNDNEWTDVEYWAEIPVLRGDEPWR